MGNIVVTKNRGMKLWANFALVTLCTLLIGALMDKPAFALNSIMHNSSTMSSKYGSWGLDKGCTWCHTAGNTANVKKIAENVATPTGSRKVVFYRMTATFNNHTGVLGNDARTYNVSNSTNVCEVCHHQTSFHQYSSENVLSGHYDNKLCTECHIHADGFKPNRHTVPFYADAGGGHPTCSTVLGCHANVNASATYPTIDKSAPDCRSCHAKDDPTATGCGSCHGDINGNGQPTGTVHPDAAGSHAAHLILKVAGVDVVCTECHTSGGSGGKTDHGKGDRNTNPAVVNLDGAFGWSGASSTCATSSCHVSPYGTAPLQSPSWGTAAGCAGCHKGTPGDFIANGAPATGSHSAHMSQPGYYCGQCHNGAVTGVSGGDNHLNNNIDVANGYPATITKHTAGTYPADRTCSTASCHSDPYSENSIVTPRWGVVSGCASCHKDSGAFAVFGAPSTGSHKAHMELIGAACNQCHEGAVKDSSGGATHANGKVDVANDYFGSPLSKHLSGSYSGYCASATCHASPYGGGPVVSPVWGSKSGCASCHTGLGTFTETGAPATGSHARHIDTAKATCGQCHTGAVSGVNPGNTHANGTVEVVSGYSVSPVTRHPIGTYAGTCANSCHTDGNGVQVTSPRWGVAMADNCAGCHGGDATVTPVSSILKTGKHTAHMNNYSTLGLGNNLICAECHAKTVDVASNTSLTGANHINGFKDYSGVRAGGSANYSIATKSCSTVYCHSSGQAIPRFNNMTANNAWNGTAKLNCSGCHGNEPGATWNSNFGAPNYTNKYDGTLKTANSHERHTVIAGATDSTACAKCHVKTVNRVIANRLRSYSSAHLNSLRDVSFAIYGNYSVVTRSCTTYCHSDVQAPGGNGAATVYAAPVWGDNGTTTCLSCHKDMSDLGEGDLDLGSHKRHAVDAGYDCNKCHGSAYTITTAETPTHANGIINTDFTGTKAQGTTYSQPGNNLPGNGYGTCSTSKCHGRATRNWGISTSLPTCEKCHGSSNTAIVDGVFKDTAGSPSSAYVGTHVAHLKGSRGMMNPIQCNECHIVPASIDSFNHMTSLPARITWGTIATSRPIIRAYTSNKAILPPAMTPAYSYGTTRSCSNTYCHAGVQIKNTDTGVISASGSSPTPKWGETTYLGGGTAACTACHGYPPAGATSTHTDSVNCYACHNHTAQSNLSFTDKSKHINGIVETTVDECLGCHSTYNECAPLDTSCVDKKLVGAHSKHTNVELFLAGKKLSTDDYTDSVWIYSIKYKGGFPQFACGFCHPMETATHKNGIVELDFNPNHALRGSVKTKNKANATWVTTYVKDESVVCNNIYCHSNGYVSDDTKAYTFVQTPDWYYSDHNAGASPWAGLDSCTQCHGNSPNTGGKVGSSAHARHVVGNHYKDVFGGYSSILKPAGAPGTGSVHGDPATATTFNCNICHFNTVRSAYNDKGSVCSSCHTTSGKGIMTVYSTGTANNEINGPGTSHINGSIDVVFMDPFTVKSKAQLRNEISSVQSVYSSWTRIKGYKTYSSHDLAKQKPNYVGGACSTTACHNGTLMEWRTKGPLHCSACHNGLPQ